VKGRLDLRMTETLGVGKKKGIGKSKKEKLPMKGGRE